MDFNQKLLKSINDALDNKGMIIFLPQNYPETILDINDAFSEDLIDIGFHANTIDSRLFLTVFAEMIEKNEVEISIKTSAKNLEYLNKLNV